MSSWVEREFAEKVFSVLPKFKRVNGAEFKLKARCPICGDSAKDLNKARFWAYPCNEGIKFHCFNCDVNMWLSQYLKDYDSTMYREYLMEKRKASVTEKPVAKAEVVFNSKMPKIEKLEFCERLDKLPLEHPIVKYVKSRCIPEDKWSRLWFTMKWPALVNSINPGTYSNEKNEPRLVIPIFNKQKEIESLQGRALRKDAPQKYITIKAHDKATKIYGTDSIDERKDVFVMEGPIDSLFVDNAIAITGGTIDLNLVPYSDNRIWVMDNEPRHPDTIKRMTKLIEAGERIVFWDKAPWNSKDINDMVKDEGASAEQIMSYIRSNVEQGLMAKMRLSRYAKV